MTLGEELGYDFQFTCDGEVITVGDGSHYTDDDKTVNHLIACYMAVNHPAFIP